MQEMQSQECSRRNCTTSDIGGPEVQAGRVMCHPRWIKFKAKYPHVKFYKGGNQTSRPSGTPHSEAIRSEEDIWFYPEEGLSKERLTAWKRWKVQDLYG